MLHCLFVDGCEFEGNLLQEGDVYSVRQIVSRFYERRARKEDRFLENIEAGKRCTCGEYDGNGARKMRRWWHEMSLVWPFCSWK